MQICPPSSPVQFRRCDTTIAFMYNFFGAVISLWEHDAQQRRGEGRENAIKTFPSSRVGRGRDSWPREGQIRKPRLHDMSSYLWGYDFSYCILSEMSLVLISYDYWTIKVCWKSYKILLSKSQRLSTHYLALCWIQMTFFCMKELVWWWCYNVRHIRLTRVAINDLPCTCTINRRVISHPLFSPAACRVGK